MGRLMHTGFKVKWCGIGNSDLEKPNRYAMCCGSSKMGAWKDASGIHPGSITQELDISGCARPRHPRPQSIHALHRVVLLRSLVLLLETLVLSRACLVFLSGAHAWCFCLVRFAAPLPCLACARGFSHCGEGDIKKKTQCAA
eukprot:3162264-Rhodomonas_salina.1